MTVHYLVMRFFNETLREHIHAFRMLMKALDDRGLAGSTFVFFTSDKGPEGDGVEGRNRGSTGGLRGRERWIYERGIRVARASC